MTSKMAALYWLSLFFLIRGNEEHTAAYQVWVDAVENAKRIKASGARAVRCGFIFDYWPLWGASYNPIDKRIFRWNHTGTLLSAFNLRYPWVPRWSVVLTRNSRKLSTFQAASISSHSGWGTKYHSWVGPKNFHWKWSNFVAEGLNFKRRIRDIKALRRFTGSNFQALL